MFSFLRREIPAMGRVLYPGAVPLPFDQLTVFKEPSVKWTTVAATPEQLWAVEASHDVWGAADIVCERQPDPLPELLIDHAHHLSGAEKARARLGESTIAVRVHAKQAHVLRDRKAGQRGEYPLQHLSDWTILSPLGRMTPRDISAARLLREKRAET